MPQKSCFQEFARYSVLSVLGTLGVSCYILADTFFISWALGARGLAALNIAIPVFNLIFGIGQMLGMGGATKFSICKGQGDRARGNTVYRNILFLGAAAALLFMAAGACFPRQLAMLLGADAEILEMTVIYLRWLLLFAPAFLFNNIFVCFVRNDEAPQLAMAATLIGNFGNIIMDYVLIFPMKLGILGAILATGVSPVVSMAVMSLHWLCGKNSFRFGKLRFAPVDTLQSLSLGFPSLLAQVSSGLVMMFFNIRILSIAGNTGIAAYGVIANLAIVVLAIYNGLAQGVQPLVSNRFGRGQREEIGLLLRYSMVTVAAASVALYLFLYVFAEPIVAVFNSERNAQLQAIAVPGLRLYFTSNLFIGFNTLLATFFISTERAVPAHILSVLRGFMLIVPLAFLLSAVWGMNGIWLAYPLAEATAAALSAFLISKKLKTRYYDISGGCDEEMSGSR